MREARVRLNRQVSKLPEKLHRFRIGNWSILRAEVQQTKRAVTPLTATVVIDYNPPSILKFQRSFRYRLQLELRDHSWRLTTVEQQSYFKGRPPRLETYDYRPFRKLSRLSNEFREFQSCFE